MPPSHPGRLIKRTLSLEPAFHDTDMMGVVHNSVYFLWFEQGRLQIMLEVLPLAEALELGVATMVVENTCQYRKAVKFGQRLLLYTTHRIQPAYEGRLVFQHYLIHEKQRTPMAQGHTTVTLVGFPAHQLIKTWPEPVWQRYQALR
ncbi:MAG: acyl-CoA thioesterase [Verrucomicrobiota bacterium]